FGAADLVIAFGASLSTHTADAGRLYPSAHIVQVTLEPTGFNHGRRTADEYVMADARLTAESLLERIGDRKTAAAIRSPELAERIRTEAADPVEVELEPGTLDPRRVHERLEQLVP